MLANKTKTFDTMINCAIMVSKELEMEMKELRSKVMKKAWSLAKRAARATIAALPYGEKVNSKQFLGWAMTQIWANFKNEGWFKNVKV